MKTQQQTFAITLRKISKSNQFLPKMSAENLKKLWDYRQDNLNLEQAKIALQAEQDRQYNVRKSRTGINKDVLASNAEKYIKLMQEKKDLLARHAKKYNAVQAKNDLQTVEQKTRATYPYNTPEFALANGIIGKINFTVDTDWDYYSKRYSRPKVEISGKCVQFVFPQIEFVRMDNSRIEARRKRVEQSVERFAGNWFLDVLARQFGVTKAEKDLRKVQLHEAFNLRRVRSIAGVDIYARIVADTVYDYCALAGKETFHAETPKLAIAGLREKRKSRVHFDSELLTFEGAMQTYHFCDTGLRNFCADNEIDPDSSLTRAELRNIVLKRRKLNCEKYSADLATVGIKLNCK